MSPTTSLESPRPPAPTTPTPRTLDAELAAELAAIDVAGLRRRLAPLRRAPGGILVTPDGRALVDFASNDYLGLAADPRPAAAAAAFLEREGVGAGAARLIAGNHPLHEALERALAEHAGTERALLFPSGYAANVGALPALAGAGDAIYSDALNHASLIDGCRLSRATVRVFPHGDVGALAALLADDAGRFRRRWIVVEGVFSMDGDLAPLAAIAELARAHGAYTYVDDAHGTAVVGPDGRGSAALCGAPVDVAVGTLGKALGAAGAFVAGSAALCELLAHRARSFVFTTGSPPAVAAAALAALQIARAEPWRRERVRANARRLRAGLAAAGLATLDGEGAGHVVPVLVGGAEETVAAGAALRARGFAVGAVRPPTVPAGTSRLRLGVSAAHTPDQVDGLVAAVGAVLGGAAG
jgi:8-amino-7-oxononanoate synthase